MADLRRVREVFDLVRALPEGDRADALEASCAGDRALLEEVRSLLDHDRGWDALEAPPLGSAADALSALDRDAHDAAPLPNLPGYDVVRVVGEGGMGLVYEAQQHSPKRRVALKVLRPGTASRAMLRRFRHESEILGRLTHPGIARIYEAGSYTIGGTRSPFFAMEFVDGVDIVAHADACELTIEDRIGLLIRLCDAVEHAHQRGVVHRDLKPSNVLVDEHGTPRVLDFGVASAVDADLRLTTMGTASGELIGTLAYMSPEQLAGDADRIDTRSDVYAIGAIAYEIISSKPAHDVAGRSLPDAILAVRDHEIAPIWTHDASLRGDLGTVVMKSLEKEPDRRYSGASTLGDDLRRLLSNEPIAARAPTTGYQLKKFAVRNRGLVVGGASVFLVLLIGVVSTSLGLARALRAEDDATEAAAAAEREAAIARAVNAFLNEDLLSAVDPTRTADREITVREALDVAAEKVGDRFAEQPMVEVAIRSTLAQTYLRLGHTTNAEPHRRRAVELLTAHLGEEDPETISAVASLSTNLMEQYRFEEAIGLITRNLGLMRGKPGLETEALRSKGNLAAAYLELGRYAEAAPILAETLEAKRAELGERDPSTLTSMHNLAGLYFALGQLEESEATYRAAFEGRAETLGEVDPKTLSSMTALTWALTDLGRFDEAELLQNRALAITRERLDPGHPAHLQALSSLGNTLNKSGEKARAERVFAELVALQEEHLGAAHGMTLRSLGNLAQTRFELGRYEDSLALLDELAEREAETLPADHYAHGTTLVLTGRCHNALGRPDLAETFLVEGVCHLLSSLGPDHPRSAKAIERVIAFFQSQDRPSDADRIRDANEVGDVDSVLCDAADTARSRSHGTPAEAMESGTTEAE